MLNTNDSKFSELASDVHSIFETIKRIPDTTIVYVLAHTEESDSGSTKIKTVGKLVDNQVNIEGLCTVVLGAFRDSDGKYKFQTQTKYGFDTCKSPMEMFDETIDNDLAFVDNEIRQYYDLKSM